MRFFLQGFISIGIVLLLLASIPLAQADSAFFQSGESAASLNSQRVSFLENLYVRQGPSIGLKALYNSLPPEERLVLIKALQQKIQGLADSGALNHPALGQLPPEMALMLKNAVMFAQATDPAVIDNIVKNTDLDHLMPLPPVAVRAYADFEANKVIPGTKIKRSEMMATDSADPSVWMDEVLRTDGYVNNQDLTMANLELLASESEVPEDEIPSDNVKPTNISPLIVEHTRVADLSSLTMANSSRLSRALNHLSNPSYRNNPMTVTLLDYTAQVHSGDELLDFLLSTGLYTSVVYDGRMFVDFVGISVKHGEDIIPVKVPTWVATTVDPINPQAESKNGRPFIVPVNHSEHILALFKKDTAEPAMLVRWYMGLPGKEVAQGTIFKPAIYQRSSWSSYRIVNSYETIDAAHKFVNGGSRIMQLYNFIQGKYKYSSNGYAVLAVCQDTTGIMEGILKGDGKEVTIWPLSRDPQLDFYYESIASLVGLKLHSVEGGSPVLDVPTDSHPGLYPFTTERETELKRIGLNIPTRNPEELHFPAVKGAISIMSEKSSVFRAALEQ